MEFKEWLQEYKTYKINERRDSAPGAFGNDIKTNFTLSNKFANFDSRVTTGKQIESLILDALRKNLNWEILPPTDNEDKYEKIDGWIIGKERIPLQIKYRDKNAGSDIFMEIMKDYYKKIPGRDMIGKARVYATLASDGKTIMIRDANEAKEIAKEMMRELENQLIIDPSLKRVNTPKGIIMISPDPATRIEKLKAYIKPSVFNWKKDVTLSTSLH